MALKEYLNNKKTKYKNLDLSLEEKYKKISLLRVQIKDINEKMNDIITNEEHAAIIEQEKIMNELNTKKKEDKKHLRFLTTGTVIETLTFALVGAMAIPNVLWLAIPTLMLSAYLGVSGTKRILDSKNVRLEEQNEMLKQYDEKKFRAPQSEKYFELQSKRNDLIDERDVLQEQIKIEETKQRKILKKVNSAKSSKTTNSIVK